MQVFIRHTRRADKQVYCTRGVEIFCDMHGIDFRDFVRNGVDAQVLIDTGDTMALRVVEAARLELENGAK